jgi:N-methylhydantoinase A/oxoprolinase/acetone carboxylase beta subunit
VSVIVGVDVGGTFTDIVASNGSGELIIRKELNQGDDLTGVARGVDAVLDELDADWHDIILLVHGTTIATNALLTGSGAAVALLATKGFRDALALRRGRRANIYDNRRRSPAPLVPRTRRYDIAERIRHDGSVLEPLRSEALIEALDDAARRGAEAIAVCFMHSYVNPAHEHRAREIVTAYARRQGLLWSVSFASGLTQEIGYYERTSTTVADAYVAPMLTAYLDRLEQILSRKGFRGACAVKQISSGCLSLGHARRTPIRTLNSGPTGAVIAGRGIARELGLVDCITFDMGGTSCDVCLIVAGEVPHASGGEVAGHHFQIPATDIVTVGAGGGSIVHVDASGLPRVGPQSAGAHPGPACYGRGGDQPTITDASVVLGLIDPASFHGGASKLDSGRARGAFRAVAAMLGVGIEQAALAAHRIVDRAMAGAVAELGARRGYDLRRAPLIVGGGAGPLHACQVATLLDLRLVVIPQAASVFSAMGMLSAELRYDRVMSVGPFELEACPWDECFARFSAMEREGGADLAQAGIAVADRRLERAVDLRYSGQFDTLTVPLLPRDPERPLNELRARFGAAHYERYTIVAQDDPLEVCALRSTARGPTPEIAARRVCTTHPMPGVSKNGCCDVPAPDLRVPFADLPLAELREGPVLVCDPYWSAWIPERWICARDLRGNVLAAPREEPSTLNSVLASA